MILSSKLRTELGSINAKTIYNFSPVLQLPREQMSQCEIFSKDSHSALCLIDSIDKVKVFDGWKLGPRGLARTDISQDIHIGEMRKEILTSKQVVMLGHAVQNIGEEWY